MQAIVVLDVSKLNIRWEEPYVSQGLNRKAFAVPSGAYRGLWFEVDNTSTLRIVVDPDSLGMEVQHFGIVEDRTNGYGISFRSTTNPIEVDCSALLTGGAAQTFYVWVEVAYSVSSATTGNLVLSNVPGDIPSDGYFLLGIIDVLAGATVLNGINSTIKYEDATYPRMTPQPTKVDAHGDYAAGNKQWGFIEGQERRNLPINDEKDAMTGAASPSASSPFAVVGGSSNLYPFVVDLSAYGSPATAIKGTAKGAGNGVHGVGDNGFGGVFEGGDAIASSNADGAAGAVGLGGIGDGSGDGGAGGLFEGGAGGATGDGGAGVYAEGYGSTIAVGPGNEGVIGLGGGDDGHGGFFVGSYGNDGGIGVEGWGGTRTTAGGGPEGVKGLGGPGVGGSNSGGDGVYGYGGAGAGLGSAGYGVHGVGRAASAGVFGEGGTGTAPGVRGVGGNNNGYGGSFLGGTSDGSGVLGYGDGTGVGVQGCGTGASTAIPSGAEGCGVYGIGASSEPGGYFQAGAGGSPGVRGFGGDFKGSGGSFSGGASGGWGVSGRGYGSTQSTIAGTPHGVVGLGGDNGRGVWGWGGTNDGVGVYGQGGSDDGIGGKFIGDGAGEGVYGEGGHDNGHGGHFVGDGQGYAILALGESATDPGGSPSYGAGVVCAGSPLNQGPGVYAAGGASSGASTGGEAVWGFGGSSSGGDGGIGGKFSGGNAGGTANDGGDGVFAEGGGRSDSNGYAGAAGHFVSSANRAHLYLPPQASLPVGGKKGDLFVRDFAGTPKLYICTATSPTAPTFVVVGTQT